MHNYPKAHYLWATTSMIAFLENLYASQLLQGSSPTVLRHRTTSVWNVAIGSTCLLLVTLSLGSLLWRVLDAVRVHKHW